MYSNINNSSVNNVRVSNSSYAPLQATSQVSCDSGSKQVPKCVDVKSNVLDSCTNTPLTPTGIDTGVIAKIPVVLAELTVQFHLNSLIKLPELALDVKNIKKRIKITQCSLLQPTNILFIKGYIRKNIDYTTGSCGNHEGICGQLHHCTVDVPFECSTPLEFSTLPEETRFNFNTEFEYFKSGNLPRQHFAEKDKLLSGDMSEFNQITIENFNELPFCDLISAEIFEFDEFIGRHRPCGSEFPVEEKFFNKMEERMVIELAVRLMQNRSVVIPASLVSPTDPTNPCPFNE